MNKKILTIIISIFLTSFLFAEVYSTKATVSYYAEDFHGKKTSNGEVFNMNDLTCASKELPFNTKVRVTNLANGKSVVVRVNDRGPFVPDRELDLSKAAAKKLDMIKTGTTSAKIEIVEWGKETKASKQTADKAVALMKQRFPGWKPHGKTVVKASAPAPRPANKIWDIQLGAFSTRENANVLAQKLLRDGFKNVVFQKSEGIYRVVIREVPSNNLGKIESELNKKGYVDYSIRERKI